MRLLQFLNAEDVWRHKDNGIVRMNLLDHSCGQPEPRQLAALRPRPGDPRLTCGANGHCGAWLPEKRPLCGLAVTDCITVAHEHASAAGVWR